jgi:hypothetical protein
MKPETAAFLDKARRSADAARRLLDAGDLDFAIGRAYYAMFYAAEALLVERGRRFRRHSGVDATFGHEFAKSGELKIGQQGESPMATRRTGRSRRPRYLRVSGTLLTGNDLVLRPSYLTESPQGSLNAERSPVQIELHGKSGLLLTWGAAIAPGTARTPVAPGRVVRYSPNGQVRSSFADHPDTRPVLPVKECLPASIRAKIPFPDETERMLIRHEELQLAEVVRPKRPPRFQEPPAIRRGGRVRKGLCEITWQAHSPGGHPLMFHVRTSSDGGRSWRRLASRLTEPRVTVPADCLVGGTRCVLQVVAYDGMNTTAAEMRWRESPKPELSVKIVPPPRRIEKAGAPSRLRAYATLTGGHVLERDAEFVWRESGEKIGRGPVLVWSAPEPGSYRLEVEVRYHKRAARDHLDLEIPKEEVPEDRVHSKGETHEG